MFLARVDRFVGFFFPFPWLFSRAIGFLFFNFFFRFFLSIGEQRGDIVSNFFFLGAMKNLTRNLFGILLLRTQGAAALTAAKPSFAAYGDSANVWGSISNTTGFVPYAGNGYAFLLPSKYNPTKERPFPDTDSYFEDNFDQVSNIAVITTKAKGNSIESYGKPEAMLADFGYLLGVQSYSGETRSEGGFAANKVSTAAVLDVFTKTDKGKTFYMFEILTRTADGDEGGRHQLISATVSDGTLYIMKLQSGDKRWFKGQERDLKQSWNSFTVA